MPRAKLALSRRLLMAVGASAVISLAATATAIRSFQTAIRIGEAADEKRASELVLCHKLAQALERKLAKSRSFILTGDESFARETEEARSELLDDAARLGAQERSPEGVVLLRRIASLEQRHQATLSRIMALRRRGARPSSLSARLVDELKPIRDELDRGIAALIARKQRELRRAEDDGAAAVRAARHVSLGAGASSACAFLVVLVLIRRLARAQSLAEETLRRSNDELDALVEARTRELSAYNRELESFSYSIAHDLRTPLRAITNFSELALTQEGGDPGLRRNLEQIRAAGLRMAELITSLLTLSRVTRRPLRMEEVDLSAIVRERFAEIASAEPARRAELRCPAGLLDRGDAHLLRAALGNLLENAWKFTSRTPSAVIEFGRRRVQGDVEAYFVRDNGAGFDSRFAHKLFAPFERLHAADEFPGTGIGLATVERVIHRHGGSAWAEGELAEGATFYFTLHRRLEHKERPAGARARADG